MDEHRLRVWDKAALVDVVSFTCGYCSAEVASTHGYVIQARLNATSTTTRLEPILQCPRCRRPSYFGLDDGQVPGPAFGEPVAHLPSDKVAKLYEEARRCAAVGAYTAATMCCRKLLMNVAVAKTADVDKPFKYYVEWLDQNGYVPPDGKVWVNHIRDKGNEANHELPDISQEDAEDVITFTSAMLKFIYELPGRLTSRKPKTP